MRMLGIDYGDVRVGAATCDSSEILASGLKTFKITGLHDCAEKIVLLASEEKCEKIVLGLPKNMDGSVGPRAQKILLLQEFIAELCEIPTDTIDERLTTVSAHNSLSASGVSGKKRKEIVDTLSAQIILQDYIDRKKG